MAQTYTQSDYLNAFLNLLPTGRIWDKDLDSNMVAAVTPLIPTYQRLSDRAVELIADAFIPTTAELLPEWQASLGLPDPCLDISAPTSVQVQQAVARFVGLGGQSVAYFLAYAAALGYSGVTITQYATFKAGSGKAGGKICAPGTAFSWLVTSPPSALLYFKAGTGTAGQKLITVLNNVLNCEFDTLKPANTKAYYSFAAGVTPTTTTTLLSAGTFTTLGNQIVDSAGKPQRICCIGWSGGNGSPAGLDGLTSIDYQTAMNMMVAMGFNAVRLLTYDRGVLDDTAMSAVDYTIGANSLLIGLTYCGVIDKILDYAFTIGLRVIIDSHVNEGINSTAQQVNGLWYDLGTGFGGTGLNLTNDGTATPGTITDAIFLSSWQTRANRWKNKPALLGYDIRNEPHTGNGTSGINWGAGGANDIRAMYQRVGNAIQAIDNKPLIICEGFQNYIWAPPWPEGDLTQVGSFPVNLTLANKVVYSVHEYPKEVGGQALDTGTAYITQMNSAWGYLVKGNIAPVWIGEMGDNMESADATSWGATMVSYLNGTAPNGPTFTGTQQPISWDWWDFNYGVNESYTSGIGTNVFFGILSAWVGGTMLPAQGAFISQLLFNNVIAGSGPVVSVLTTWDAANKTGTINLSAGNLIATATTTTAQSVLGTQPLAAGKAYFEVAMTTASHDWAIGLCTAAFNKTASGGIGSDTNGAGYYAVSPYGQIYCNSIAQLGWTSGPDVSGAIISVAVDFGAKLIWLSSPQLRAAGGWNGLASANPASGVGGADLSQLALGPYFIVFNDLEAGVATLNCGASAFNQTMPVGYSSWNQLV